MTLSSDDLKRCCARAYQHDVVALVLGDSYHPGGRELTRRDGPASVRRAVAPSWRRRFVFGGRAWN